MAILLALPARGGDDERAREEDEAVEAATRRAVARLEPSVVEIETIGGIPERHDAPLPTEGQPQAPPGKGVLVKEGFKQAFGPSTGIVVRKDGLILTSTFVLAREPRHVFVTLHDGRALVAKVLGRDVGRHLALLKVDADGLVVPAFAARDEAKVGRFALAVGRGLGASRASVSVGIVSARDRAGGRAIQSSAAISPVNYGGPLASIEGSVFGLLVPLSPMGGEAGADVYDSGIGFAIPIADALEVLPRLERGERLEPGFLGVVIDPASAVGGARVREVAPDSPAARAGVRSGDTIVEVDDVKIAGQLELQRALARKYVGDRVKLVVERKEKRLELEVKLGKRPKIEMAPGPRMPKPPGEDPR